MPRYDDFEDGRIKHLEMLQAVIARLGNDGFLVKGWAVTVAGAFLGFAVNNDKWELAVAGIVPTLVFWGLDALFLRAERLFRELYDFVRSRETGLPPFFMAATGPRFTGIVAECGKPELGSWLRTAARPALVLFYLALVAAALVVSLALCYA